MNPSLSQYAFSASQHCSFSFVIKKITIFKEFDAASVPGSLFLLMAYIPGEIPVPVLNSFDGKLHEHSANLKLIIIMLRMLSYF